MEIVWDFDGVLIEPWRFRHLLEAEYGIGPATTQPFFKGPFLDCLTSQADLLEELPHFLGLWGWRGSIEEFVDLWFEVENAPRAQVFDFVATARARGVRCHVASNQERHRVRYLTDVMGLGHHFDRLFFSSTIGACKPDPEFFSTVERELGRTGPELLFADDSEANVRAARDHGWSAIHFTGIQDLQAVAAALEGSGT